MTQTMGTSEPDRIVVRGLDLCDQIIGRLDFGAMIFLELVGRAPTEAEDRIVNAVLVSLVEHGITPSAIATRLTAFGAPDSLQGAVAAGLLGVGGGLVGAVEGSARLYQEIAAEPPERRGDAIDAAVARARGTGARLPGLGHPIHRPHDPRTATLFALAETVGTAAGHQAIAEEVRTRAEHAYGKVLPLNVDGAIGAVLSDIGFPWQSCRGFAVIARCAGLVGHVLDEQRDALARDVWLRADAGTDYTDPDPAF